ncbi:MAG: YkgJ family cysteine cluster protein [Peptococcaceae bacterium]|nr:YkgJ family cysteine cluster protein [Peptococcaceae bacterium]
MIVNCEIPGAGLVFDAESKFKFDCHSGLSCFGQCCRDINIFLTPYDVIRLKKKLDISSKEFLKLYTGELKPPQLKFPLRYLKMSDDDQLSCRFLTSRGCAVYQERPWSCRMAPVDIAGPGRFRFSFDREKCLGLNEEREWTVRSWMESQDMGVYDQVESTFKEIPALIRFTGRESLEQRIVQLFSMVCYDIDTFRDFILRNKFLVREGGIDREAFQESLKDDVQLLKTGIQWLVSVAGSVKTLKKIDKIL